MPAQAVGYVLRDGAVELDHEKMPYGLATPAVVGAVTATHYLVSAKQRPIVLPAVP